MVDKYNGIRVTKLHRTNVPQHSFLTLQSCILLSIVKCIKMLNSTLTQNGTDHISRGEIEGVTDDASWIAFWFCVVLTSIAGIISVVGNGLVLYVSKMKNNTGRFKHVNFVVRNLALSDFLFGLVGTPCGILYWYWGKKLK